MKPIIPGMKARLIDGGVATVVDVLIDTHDRTARYVVLNTRGYFCPDVLAPFSAVWRVDDAVHLALTGAEVSALPCYDHYAQTYSGLNSRSAWRHGAARPTHRPAQAR